MVHSTKDLISVLKLSGEVRSKQKQNEKGSTHTFWEVFEPYSPTKVFCFMEDGHMVSLHVRPSTAYSASEMSNFIINIESSRNILELQRRLGNGVQKMKEYLGGYTLWDSNMERGALPKLLLCGSIFDKSTMKMNRFGENGSEVQVGGFASKKIASSLCC